MLFDGKWLARDIAEGHEKTSELPDSLRFYGFTARFMVRGLRKDRAMNLLPICLLIKRLNSTICRCHQGVTKVGLFADVSKTAESQNERSRF